MNARHCNSYLHHNCASVHRDLMNLTIVVPACTYDHMNAIVMVCAYMHHICARVHLDLMTLTIVVLHVLSPCLNGAYMH